MWEEEESEDEDRLSKNKRKVNKKCKDFLYFKPKRDQGLYKELAEQGIEGSEVFSNYKKLLSYQFLLYPHRLIPASTNERCWNFKLSHY